MLREINQNKKGKYDLFALRSEIKTKVYLKVTQGILDIGESIKKGQNGVIGFNRILMKAYANL